MVIVGSGEERRRLMSDHTDSEQLIEENVKGLFLELLPSHVIVISVYTFLSMY